MQASRATRQREGPIDWATMPVEIGCVDTNDTRDEGVSVESCHRGWAASFLVPKSGRGVGGSSAEQREKIVSEIVSESEEIKIHK
jgi:hypothetical protein